MKINHIYQGDSLTVLKTFPDESIDCCITSPPYWGLRDYQTAKWVGGKSSCDHKVGRATRGGLSEFQKANKGSFGDEAIRKGEKCPHCGAVRVDDQLGLEKTPEEYVIKMVEIFREFKRVLKDHGTLWLNLGDSYASVHTGGHKSKKASVGNNQIGIQEIKQSKSVPAKYGLKEKDLVGIPWRVAFALQSDGWYLRQDIIWAKPNPMPESVTDRCTKAHEYIFLLTKSPQYYFDNEAIKEPISETYSNDKRPHGVLRQRFYENSKYIKEGMMVLNTSKFPNEERAETRNKRSVWTITTKPFKGSHFATFPEDLIIPMIKAGTSEKGVCPECGKAWVRVVKNTPMPRNDKRTHSTENQRMGKTPCPEPSNGVTGGTSETLGWKPQCSCNCNPGPAAVLDPFMGAGTTGLVARKLGRDYVGIELNPEYIKMAETRIHNETGLI